MEDAEKYVVQFKNFSLSQFHAEKGSSGSTCIESSATADDFLKAAASEQASTSHAASMITRIELSKYHWTECAEKGSSESVCTARNAKGSSESVCNASIAKGSSGSTCIASSATAGDFLKAAASEQASTSHAASVMTRIELSKSHWSEQSHWSERAQIDCNSTDDEIATDNLEVFKSLQQHPQWGNFFLTFGYETIIAYSAGEMVVGEKFAEGGQAELFYANITWENPKYNDYCEKTRVEWVLKVFKKGTSLRQLQSQWPVGFLLLWATRLERQRLGYPLGLRWVCDVKHGTLMRDGRFAFLMVKEWGDLRSLIDENMLKCGDGVGPFSKHKAEHIMYDIARGVELLHKNDIIHRDINASNVLVSRRRYCQIADYECSIGVVGTGFWRAPEILQACKDYTINQRPELFSKASDVYSYGMTCYEVLTGDFPFRNEGVTISNVIKGQQPQVLDFVDAKYKDLLLWCWQLEPTARPSIGEVLSFLEANSKSKHIRKGKLQRMKVYDGEHALLGCTNFSHNLALLECAINEAGESYVCKLCLEMGNGEVYHCTSCGDFDLHPECARVPRKLVSLHPHELDLFGPYNYPDHHVCDGCFEGLEDSQWMYRCTTSGCEFNLHARCGKYAKTIIHASHEEHKLLLISNLGVANLDGSVIICDGCKIRIRCKELVYHCMECKFNIHPRCALGNLVGR